MKNIYLFHETDIENLYDIIDNKFLLSFYITKNKNQNPYDIYLPYIFMNCCIKEDFQYLSPYTFIFSSTICHSAENINSSNYFRKNTSKTIIYNELSNLLTESKKVLKNWEKNKYAVFKVYQEIFFRKKISLYNALYIVLPKNIDIKLLDKIKYNLPKIKILFFVIYILTPLLFFYFRKLIFI